jgi:AcrR family transcriptional regulator
MPTSLRQEHRDATRRRIVTAARKVFVKKGYTKATIEEITAAAGVSRATLYLHFDSKFALLTAAAEKMSLETREAGHRLAKVLAAGDRADLRQWIEWALGWYVRNRPMALAAQEAELGEDKSWEVLRTYLECLEPWVETWPPARRTEALMRYELCRLQMYHYMWGNSHEVFGDQELPVDLFTEIWWNTLKAPLMTAADDGRAVTG